MEQKAWINDTSSRFFIWIDDHFEKNAISRLGFLPAVAGCDTQSFPGVNTPNIQADFRLVVIIPLFVFQRTKIGPFKPPPQSGIPAPRSFKNFPR